MDAQVSAAPVSTTPTAEGAATSRTRNILLWVGQLTVVALLGMGAFHKFFNFTPEGSAGLADALGVGRGTILMIGAVEVTAVLLTLIPRTRAVGALLAAVTLAGALVSHATRIGFSGSAAAEMWPLALVGLIAGGLVAYARRAELPFIGR